MLDRVSKPVWSKSGVKESRKSIDNSLPINIYLKIYANIFGYPGHPSYIYHVLMIKIKVMTQATMHSHSVLEEVIYQLQSKGAIVDPCIVDDLITCIKTHKKFEFK
ncbi:hypothetical protein N9H34_02215 [bacterium]|nr:hypothetical protein [bacterium]